MAERLFGLETEYGLTALDTAGRPVERLPLLQRMMGLARRRLPHLPDGTGRGMFLANGARVYIDVPDHFEYSTPEVTDPWEAVRHVRAGDHLLATMVEEVCADDPSLAEVIALRSNVDYSGSGATWASHESYLHRVDPAVLPEQLIPHLVSRIVYCGAGGFDATFTSGLPFSLSPRVWHLGRVVSPDSTHSRGIFHTKNEPLAKEGYQRLHVLSGETLCSHTALWLRVAATALVVALIDGGVRPGDAVHLRSPVAAMRGFNTDPTCTALARGRHRLLSALDVQRHYLEVAEEHAGAPFMPPWAGEACRRWREILAQLGCGPEAVATTLDWGIKLALYRDLARRRGVPWESLGHWNHAARSLRAVYGDPVPAMAAQAKEGTLGRIRRQVALELRRHGRDWSGFDAFVALRSQLFEVDTRFAQIGGRGIFDALDRAGALAHRVAGIGDAAAALDTPPAVGRARLRGEQVRRLAAEGGEYICDWSSLRDLKGRRSLDLSDPFSTEAEWLPWRPNRADLLATAVRESPPF